MEKNTYFVIKIKTLSYNQFQLRGDLIDLINSTLFDRQPAAILQLFYQMAEQENIQGIYSATLRQLRFACQKLTKPLCEIPIARKILLLFCAPRTVEGAIVPMHLHDVLSYTIRVLQKLDQFADQNIAGRL